VAPVVKLSTMGDEGDPVGDLHLATIVVNVRDMERAVRFWTAALGYQRLEAEWDAQFQMLVDPQGRYLPVSLQRTDSVAREPVRLHLDLYTDAQAEHVERLIKLGATRVDDWPYPDDADFVVLRDPDGNEFCVIGHAEL
jgi:catechol 2,3-dioxygenase-like lactoylglutathione lyase family enzyme